MREAILPFFEYCVLQLVVATIGLNAVREQNMGPGGLLKTWIIGQMLLLAVLQVMAVPMILARWRFEALYWSYICVAAIMFGFGCRKIRHTRFRVPARHRFTLLEWCVLVVAVILISVQIYKYFFMMHLDEDDARWLAEANDALVTGNMMIRNVHTGEYLGWFGFAKDVASPWALMYAVVAKLLHTRTAIVAHTIYPPFEVLAMYGAYWLMGTELFEKNSAKLTFLLSVIVINLFFAGTLYTQSVFSLVRIWQGKATVAAVIMPLLLYLFARIHKRNRTDDWLLLGTIGAAASLMSGMGISMSTVVIGLYGAYDIVAYQRWRRIPLLCLALLPSVLFAAIYAFLKG